MKTETPETEEVSLLRRSGDLPLRVGIAVNDTIKSLSDFFGAASSVSQLLSNNSQWYADLLSAQAVENDKEVARILEEAKGKGTLGSLACGLRAFSVAPADFLASGVGSLLPFLAGGALAKVGGLGYMGAGVVQAGLTSVIQIGAVKGGIYEEVKSELISQGIGEEEAKKQALEAQSYGGENTDQMAVAGVLGVVAGRVGAHRAITRGLFRGGFSACREKAIMVGKEGLWESGMEGLQGGHERLAGNLSLQRKGVEIGAFSGVGANASLEGTVGLFMGGGMTAVTPTSKGKEKQASQSEEAKLTEDVSTPSRSINIERGEEFVVLPEPKTNARADQAEGDVRNVENSAADESEVSKVEAEVDKKTSLSEEVSIDEEGEGLDAGKKFTVPKVSPGKQKALGIQDNPVGVFLVASQPHLFQGVGTNKQYQEKLGGALARLEGEIDEGKYLNTAYDIDSHERTHKVRLSREEAARRLEDHRKKQVEIQQGWKNYLKEGGYTPEQRFLVLSTIVKEVAKSGKNGTRVHQLGEKSNSLPCAADPETAALFFDKFKGDSRPSVVLNQADTEVAIRKTEQLKSLAKATHTTEWGGTITWTKFLRGKADPAGLEERAKQLATVSKTVDQFGMASWCCKGDTIAKGFLEKGDFWVGVDEQGRARVSVRLDGEKQLKEISGVLPGQAMEPKFAKVVAQFVKEQGFRDGDIWIRDAELKGRVAEMKDPGSWEEFKDIIRERVWRDPFDDGGLVDDEAVRFFREYRGPKGIDDFLVGSDNGALNRTIWEKTKNDGLATPLTHAAIRGQFSQAMEWIDHSMLDTIPEHEEPVNGVRLTHGQRIFAMGGGVSGADVFRAFASSGYLTPERQMALDDRGLPMIASAAYDAGKIKLLSEFEGLVEEGLRVPNVDGDTGFMLIAGGPAEIAEQALSTLSSRGIMKKSDQWTTNHSGQNLFFRPGGVYRNSNADGLSGSSLSLMIGKDWVDHNALFVPSGPTQSTPVMRLSAKENGDMKAIVWLRDNGHLTPERQRHANAERNNMLHLYADGHEFRELLGWDGLDGVAMRSVNNRGDSPATIHLGGRLPYGSDGDFGVKMAMKYLDADTILGEGVLSDGMEVENSRVKNGKTEPLVFSVARAGGLLYLLEEGVVTPRQISECREDFSGKKQTPWHDMKFVDSMAEYDRFDRLVANGTITPQILMERDAEGTMVSTKWMEAGNRLSLFNSPVLTSEVRIARDPEGRTFGHHVAKRGALAEYLTSPQCGRDEIEATSNNSNTMLHDFNGGSDPLVDDWGKISTKLKKEDLSRLNADGEKPAHKFIPHEAWAKMLVARDLVDESILTHRSGKTGDRPLDLIPRHHLGETLLMLGEEGMVSRGTLTDSSKGPSLLKRFVEAVEPTSRSLSDGLISLQKNCGLTAGDLGPHEIHTIIHRTKPWHLETSEIRILAEAGLVSEESLYEHDGYSEPVIFGAVEKTDRDLIPDTEAFQALLDNGLVPPGRLRERSGEGQSYLAGRLLEQAGKHGEWKTVVLEMMDKGQFDRDSIFCEYETRGGGKNSMVADLLFAEGNGELLQKSIDTGLVRREDFAEGGKLASRALDKGMDSLSVLSKNGMIQPGDLGKIEIETWKGKFKGGHYLLEEKPEQFVALCRAGIITRADVFSEKRGREEALEHAVDKGKLGLLGEIADVKGFKIDQEAMDRAWYQSGLSRNTGDFVDFLRKTGMEDSAIRRSLTSLGEDATNNLGELAKMGGDRILPLTRSGIIGRSELLGQFVPVFKGGDRDALNAVLSSSPENWAELMKSGVLEKGDLYRNQSSYYPSPVRRLISRCNGAEEEVQVATKISESGILHPEEKTRLAIDLSKNKESGKEALKTFILRGDISPENLSEKRDKQSALDFLVENSTKSQQAKEMLEFLRDNKSVVEQDLPRVQRAIDGEISPIRDAMDSIGGTLNWILKGGRKGGVTSEGTVSKDREVVKLTMGVVIPKQVERSRVGMAGRV